MARRSAPSAAGIAGKIASPPSFVSEGVSDAEIAKVGIIGAGRWAMALRMSPLWRPARVLMDVQQAALDKALATIPATWTGR